VGEAFAHLPPLLEELDVQGSEIGPREIRGDYPLMKKLALSETDMSVEQIRMLLQRCPNVKRVEVLRTKFSEKVLKALKEEFPVIRY
jgi:hypothetical protein